MARGGEHHGHGRARSADSIDIPGVAKHLVNFVSLYMTHFLKFSSCFCALLTVKHWQFLTPKTPKNESQKGLQNSADVLQHPVVWLVRY